MRLVLLLLLCLAVGLPAGDAHADRRQLGIQIGGSGFVEAVGRFRVYRGLSVEIGGLAITHAMNLSLGAEVEGEPRARVGLYVSGGAAFAGVFGSTLADEACMPATEDCAYVAGGAVLTYGYARAGVRWRFRDGTRALSADVGAWLGTWNEDEGPRSRSGWFAAPVAGLSYLWLVP